MIDQLIFTSVPKGLRPGTSGFTTVAATPDLTPPLIARLESLSAYRFVYPVGDEREVDNPICFAHRRLRLNGRNYNVLSRVAPAGSDYTGRSNILGHHLLLGSESRAPVGPAWLLQNDRVFVDHWDEPPKVLSADHAFASAEVPPSRCDAWEQVTGDAGWGGTLVDALADHRGKPAYVIYPPSMDVLSLVAESILLLPPEKRWDVTFDTCFAEDHSDIICHWRFVQSDSEAAGRINAGAASIVIDLTGKLDPPTPGPGVEAARAGSIYRPPQPPAEAVPIPEVEVPADAAGSPVPPPLGDVDLSGEIEGRPAWGGSAGSVAGRGRTPGNIARRRNRRLLQITLWLILILGLIMLLIVAMALRIQSQNNEAEGVELDNAVSATPASQRLRAAGETGPPTEGEASP